MTSTLANIIKCFRHNVRAGNPCELRFDGKTVQLHPIHTGLSDKEEESKWNATKVGMIIHPSIGK